MEEGSFAQKLQAMNSALPYYLPGDNKTSNQFYIQLSEFTDATILELNNLFGKYISDFKFYSERKNTSIEDNPHSSLLELLMLGIFWNNYSGNASQTNKISISLLRNLYKLRKQYPGIKDKVDGIRGYLSGFLLEHNKYEPSAERTASGLSKLLSWMSATGEFNEEVTRLNKWIPFLESRNKVYGDLIIQTSLFAARQFHKKAIAIFGKTTSGLKEFQEKRINSYKGKEDYFLASRKENEYYLNMFGAELLNRELEQDFRKTITKALLLPTCMRTEPSSGCKAAENKFGLVCLQCNSDCNIGKKAGLMKKEGIHTYLIPHSSQFSKFLVKWQNQPDTGLIGVACILNLLTGGYEMKRLGIASQCVFLDYCGCKKHWNEDGLPTDLNDEKLLEITSSAVSITNVA